MNRIRNGIAICWVAGAVASGGSPSRADTLTLDDCVRLALERNGSIEYGLPQSKESYHRARQDVWTAWGGLLPRLSHDYRYNQNRVGSVRYSSERRGFVDVPEELRKTVFWNTSFNLSHDIFDGGANAYTVAQAYHFRAAQAERLRAAENELVKVAKERYFILLKSQRLVEVQAAAVRRAEQFLKTIEGRYELGSASLSEVLKAKVELGKQQFNILSSRNEVETARARLNSLLNRPIDEPLEIADVGDIEPEVPTYEEALQIASSGSPDVLGAQADLRVAKDEIGIARAKLFPSVNWSVSRSYTPRERKDIFDFDSRFGSWNISAGVSLSLFNGFDSKTAISNARVGLKYARESLAQNEQAVGLGVKENYLAVQLEREKRALADQTEASAQEDFNLAQEKYNLGAATILDLLNAQESLTTAQTDKVNAMFDYHVAVARLENAMGRGL